MIHHYKSAVMGVPKDTDHEIQLLFQTDLFYMNYEIYLKLHLGVECREIIPEIIWLLGQEVESVKYECFAEFISFRGHKCKISDIYYILSYKCSAAIGLFWDIVLLVASNPVNNLH